MPQVTSYDPNDDNFKLFSQLRSYDSTEITFNLLKSSSQCNTQRASLGNGYSDAKACAAKCKATARPEQNPRPALCGAYS